MNEADIKHEENLKKFDEIKQLYDVHAKKDEDFQQQMLDQLKRMEPMIKAFENKKIARMEIQEDTKTIIFYLKSVGTFVTSLIGLWAIVKYLLAK